MAAEQSFPDASHLGTESEESMSLQERVSSRAVDLLVRCTRSLRVNTADTGRRDQGRRFDDLLLEFPRPPQLSK